MKAITVLQIVSAIRYLLKKKKENTYPHGDIYINIHRAIYSNTLNVKRIEGLIVLCCMYPLSDQEESYNGDCHCMHNHWIP